MTASNALANQAIVQAQVKTGQVDADVLLAQLLRCGYLPEVWPSDRVRRRQWELCGQRWALLRQRTVLHNRIHSVSAMRLVETPWRLFSAAGRHWVKNMLLDKQARVLLDNDLRHLDAVQSEIDALQQTQAQRGYASAQVRLRMTLPGMDQTTAQGLLAAWGDVQRFPDADHAAGNLGLVPSTR